MLNNDNRYSRQLRDRAFKLADSGLFDGWRSIENAMVGEGWLNCHKVLESDYLRLSLDDHCRAAH
mgnify:CR=1 FL=1